MDEMLTPGSATYTTTVSCQTHTRVDSPLQIQLFLFFMHAELDQVQSQSQPQKHPVMIGHCTISRSWNVLTEHLSKVLLSTPRPTRRKEKIKAETTRCSPWGLHYCIR